MATCNQTPQFNASDRHSRGYFFINTGTPGVRFLQYDKPTETTFLELFQSVGFISDCRDTAKKEEQGFVVCAKDPQSEARDSTPDSNGFTKAVIPHQLPNVYPMDGSCGIAVTEVINPRNCCDGTAKDFELENTMVVSAANLDTCDNPSPLGVIQAGPGCEAIVTFDATSVFNCDGVVVPPGQVTVCCTDTTAVCLSEAFTTTTPCFVEIEPTTTDPCEIDIRVTPFLVDEIRLFAGNTSQLGSGQYTDWYLCDGNNGTIDLRGKYPIGFDGNVYSPIGGTLGNHDVLLTEHQCALRAHSHVVTFSGTASTTNSGAHKHDIRKGNGHRGGGYDIGTHRSSGWYGGADGSHSHTLDMASINAQATPVGVSPATQSFDNRPESVIVAFIQYKGAALAACV
tara:strand:- start:520 stop:1713 length:1194 start_codon:yes stop_codon:yes gene_type:complete